MAFYMLFLSCKIFAMKSIYAFRALLLLSFLMMFSVHFPIQAQAPKQVLTEEAKIEKLLKFIENADVVFIRNGTEYSAVDASKHLRMKREKAGNKIQTAKAFIDNIASKSSVSGEPYQMKFKNGSLINVRDILYYELKKMEGK